MLWLQGVGHYTDLVGITGCTAVLVEAGAVCGVDIRGSAPGSRETALLDPVAVVQRVHGILLSGGSAFGLAAAEGVMKYFEERGVGIRFRGNVIPIVPAAVLFDLEIGSATARPNAEAGYMAAAAASAEIMAEGSVGAGTGATVGKVLGMRFATKGGIGSWCIDLPGGVKVGALAVVNALGDIFDNDGITVLAGCREKRNGVRVLARDILLDDSEETVFDGGCNTTLGVIATNVILTKPEVTKVAQMAQAGLVRVIDPANTTVDGDCVFALSIGDVPKLRDLTVLGEAAAKVFSVAIRRAVSAATPLGGIEVG